MCIDRKAVRVQVREQNPKLAKQSRVLKVSMDNVYDFAVTPEVDKKTAGVSFRFMPDLKQVQKALEVRPHTLILALRLALSPLCDHVIVVHLCCGHERGCFAMGTKVRVPEECGEARAALS